MSTRVFAYLRVSTAEQLDKGGHKRQIEEIQRFCTTKGFVVVRDFGDQQSGGDKFEARKKLQECLDLCTNATNVMTIVVERADRIARDMIEQEVFLRECEKRGVLVYSADSGEELVMADSDPTRKLIRRIMGALAEWEKDQTAKKLLAGRRRKKFETGKPCGGPQPYGEAANPARRQSEQAVIAEIMALYNAGNSFLGIARALRISGFPPPSGKWWHHETIRRIVHRELEKGK